jgi:NarL family two-component system response regulator LiaR
MTIRVVLIDDQEAIHDATRTLLKDDPEISLVGEAMRGDEAVDVCRLTKPDIVLMDVVMPGMSGAEATRALLAEFPEVRVLVLSSFREYEKIKEMLDSGAAGYLVKDAIIEDLLSAIHATYTGHTVLSHQAATTLLSSGSPPPLSDYGLTERELQVLREMAEGHTDAQIAHTLEISPSTIRFHQNNILQKMNVATRSQALVAAARLGLI